MGRSVWPVASVACGFSHPVGSVTCGFCGLL